MPSPFIPDGYTRETTLPACELWDEIQLTYRPMAGEDFAGYLARAKGLDDAGWSRLVWEMLADKIVAWNIPDQKGEVLPIAPEQIRRLVHPLPTRLWEKLCGSVVQGDTAKN